jgi:diguanylate cyclase (GGDEF)-like protein
MPHNPDPRLQQLVDGMVRLAGGDLTTRIQPSSARDDIDAVITGVNLLAEELQLSYMELEQRVEQRTAELRQAHRDMSRMALTDALTGLANRTALAKDMDAALDDARSGQRAPALLLLDMDSFKQVNDSFGHDAGDRVLTVVANRLRSVVRDGDTVARLGGDEFAVLLPRATADLALQVAQRILGVLNDEIQLDEVTVWPQASIGVRVADAGQTAQSLLLDADTAMYEAKKDPQNRTKVFQSHMLQARQLHNQMASELRGAIATGGFELEYQPVVDLCTGLPIGVEALVRWNHPVRGRVMPSDFIPMAEQTGLIVDLGRWTLSAAAHQFAQWSADLNLDPGFQIRVNLSVAELQRIDLVEHVRGVLRDSGMPAESLVLEITETGLVTGGEVETYSLLALRKLGIGIEIDDFGTGYSSISYLRRLPVDMVKVDRSIIATHSADGSQQDFIGAVLQLIRAAGLDAIFEGIETREQAEQLRDLGCSGGQGFYFSRPVSASLMARLLRSGASLPAAVEPSFEDVPSLAAGVE